MKPRLDVQPVDRKGAIYAGIALGFAALYQAIWVLAPGIMKIPVTDSIPFSVPFGVVAIFAPLLFAWLCARSDVASNETYDTSKH